MNKSFKTGLIAIIGFVILAATFGVYMLFDFTKNTDSYIGIAFVLFSELALFLGIIRFGISQDTLNRIFAKAGIISTLVLYCIATVTLCLFSGIFNNLSSLWIFEIIALALMIVIVSVILLLSGGINSSEQKIVSDRKLMMICEKRIADLLSVIKNKPYRSQLIMILEKLKYCDKIGSSSVDERIVGQILKLEKELSFDNPNPGNIFQEITALISQRNMEIADIKRGKF